MSSEICKVIFWNIVIWGAFLVIGHNILSYYCPRLLYLNGVYNSLKYTPEHYGINGTVNFYIDINNTDSLGVWMILPEEYVEKNSSLMNMDYFMNLMKNEAITIIIFHHGVLSTRAKLIQMYAVLRKTFLIISFDYRGFADSSRISINEDTLFFDSIFIFDWVRNRTKAKILVYAHSLGTSIATKMVSTLPKSENIIGLVLVSPFTTMRAVLESTYSPQYLVNLVLEREIKKNHTSFNTVEYIRNVNCRILIIHARDDKIVPYRIGFDLYNITKHNRSLSQGVVSLVSLNETFGCGHSKFYRYPNFSNILKNFAEDYEKMPPIPNHLS